MAVERAVLARIKSLIDQGRPVSPVVKQGHALTADEEAIIAGWLTSVTHVLELTVPPLSAYRLMIGNINASYAAASGPRNMRSGERKSNIVGEAVSILEALLADVEAGMISSLEDRVRGQAFDDFLEHAEEYVKRGRKNEAGVIAGVVFEDTMRSIGERNDVTNSQLAQVINGLVSSGVISKTQSKRAKVAAHVRTKATHAEWGEFEMPAVEDTIRITREMIGSHLDA